MLSFQLSTKQRAGDGPQSEKPEYLCIEFMKRQEVDHALEFHLQDLSRNVTARQEHYKTTDLYHIEDTLKPSANGPAVVEIVLDQPPIHPDAGRPNFHYLIMTRLRSAMLYIMKASIHLGAYM